MVEEKFSKHEKFSKEERLFFEEQSNQLITLDEFIEKLKKKQSKQIEKLKYYINVESKKKLNQIAKDYYFSINKKEIIEKLSKKYRIKRSIIQRIIESKDDLDIKKINEFWNIDEKIQSKIIKEYKEYISKLKKENYLRELDRYYNDKYKRKLKQKFKHLKMMYKNIGDYIALDFNSFLTISELEDYFLYKLYKAKNKEEFWDNSEIRKFLAKLPKNYKVDKEIAAAINPYFYSTEDFENEEELQEMFRKRLRLESEDAKKIKNRKIEQKNLKIIPNTNYNSIYKKTFKRSKLTAAEILRELKKVGKDYYLIKK